MTLCRFVICGKAGTSCLNMYLGNNMKNIYLGAVVIGLTTLGMVGCSGQESSTSDHKPGQMAEHNPQMHDANMHNEGQKQKMGHQMQTDERIAVILSPAERLHVLAEMRGLLQSTQNIIEGLATDNMDLVQEAALAAGTHGRKTTENNIMHKKMPAEWMQLGMKAHKTMDEIAQMAADAKPANEIQLKLVSAMNACTACHAAYQLPNP